MLLIETSRRSLRSCTACVLFSFVCFEAYPVFAADDSGWGGSSGSDAEADDESSTFMQTANESLSDTIDALDLIQSRREDLPGRVGIVENSASWGCWLGTSLGGPCLGPLGTMLAALYGVSQSGEQESYFTILLGSIPGLLYGLLGVVYLFAAGTVAGALYLQFQSDPVLKNVAYGTDLVLTMFSLLTWLAGPITMYGIVFARKWLNKPSSTASYRGLDASTKISFSDERQLSHVGSKAMKY